jgi:hypothetical protein
MYERYRPRAFSMSLCPPTLREILETEGGRRVRWGNGREGGREGGRERKRERKREREMEGGRET